MAFLFGVQYTKMFFFLPFCFQCGTDDNPCRCKIVGPTLGFVTGVVSAVFLWPAGAVTWFIKKDTGKKLFGTPVELNAKVSNAIPI